MERFEATTSASEHETLLNDVRQAWDNLCNACMDGGLDEQTNRIIREAEFKKLIRTYEEQGRPDTALRKLLADVHNEEDDVARLAYFYKDTSYAPHGTLQQNRARSYEIARDFLDVIGLSEEQKKTFAEKL